MMEGKLRELIQTLAEEPEDGPPRSIAEPVLREAVVASLWEILKRLEEVEQRISAPKERG
jgi:hypothetical protein